jgi:peptide-methionine (S)-S-oxide reductase
MRAANPGGLIHLRSGCVVENVKIRNAIALFLFLGIGAATLPAAAQGTSERVVLAGGCFWGMQLVFEELKGVDRVVAGYSGGTAATAQYETVSTGATGHAESVEITYDPAKISFRSLLDVYFEVAHDPTELNRQGPDEGSQYRSEIFYTTDAQRAQAIATIAHLKQTHVFSEPIVTIVAPLRGFYRAEAYHQEYALHNPHDPYIVYNDLPKLKSLSREFPELIKPNPPFPV